MKLLSYGMRGPQVQLLQLALQRAGYRPGGTDGLFGGRTDAALRRFQTAAGLDPDGIAGPRTHAALRPYYTGYLLHSVRPGETLYRLSLRYGTTVRAIELANPGVDPFELRPGQVLTVPLGFSVVPTDIDYCAELVDFCCEGIAARYPFVENSVFGQSLLGRPLRLLRLGEGEGRVFFNAAHHANEWITTPLLLRFAEDLAAAWGFEGQIGGESARDALEGVTLALAPCVNPDGLDLVTGELRSGPVYAAAAEIAAEFPGIPFPEGWKANLAGTDLNLQYPAGWDQAREIKFAQGFDRPAPRDYVGLAPLSAPESRAVHDFTLDFAPVLTLSYHTQGAVIYWKYLDLEPPGARELAYRFASESGYAVEDVPYASGFAGYKDWFIDAYGLPGFTIEAGRGENPLPLSQFEEIYRDNLGILLTALAAGKSEAPAP